MLQTLEVRGFELLLSPLGELLRDRAPVTESGPQPARQNHTCSPLQQLPAPAGESVLVGSNPTLT